MWVSHTAVVELASSRFGNSVNVSPKNVRCAPPVNSWSSGTSDIWIGTARSATTPMNSQWRPGNSIQAKA